MIKIEDFLINIKETDVNWIKINKGVVTYLSIMNDINKVNISANNGEKLRKEYSNFYGLNRRNLEFKKTYFKIFEDFKAKKKDDFTSSLNKIHQSTNRIEASFSSKMIATLNPNKPILDSVLLKNLGMRMPYYNSPNRIHMINLIYQQIEDNYDRFLKTNLAKKWIDKFDKKIGKTNISSMKKIDFIIWQTNR